MATANPYRLVLLAASPPDPPEWGLCVGQMQSFRASQLTVVKLGLLQAFENTQTHCTQHLETLRGRWWRARAFQGGSSGRQWPVSNRALLSCSSATQIGRSLLFCSLVSERAKLSIDEDCVVNLNWAVVGWSDKNLSVMKF